MIKDKSIHLKAKVLTLRKTNKKNGDLTYIYPSNPDNFFDRVAFIGDSFKTGWGVKDEHTLSAQFKSALKKQGVHVEVLNLGISGSSTPMQVNYLESFGLKFDPDDVVLVVFLNDAGRDGTMEFMSGSRLFSRLRSVSFLINGLFESFERAIFHEEMVSHYLQGYQSGNVGWEKMQQGILRAKQLLTSHDFRLIVTVFPVLFKLDESYPFEEIHRTIGDFCKSEGILFLDLLDGFRGQHAQNLWIHPQDQHPNSRGQAIAAKALHAFFTGLPSDPKQGSEIHNHQ